MNEKEFEKLDREVELMLNNEDAELDFDDVSQHFKDASEWLRARCEDSADDESELPDNAAEECDLYETLGVEDNEDFEEVLEDIAGGGYDED